MQRTKKKDRERHGQLCYAIDARHFSTEVTTHGDPAGEERVLFEEG
jgi:hypothetical protein